MTIQGDNFEDPGFVWNCVDFFLDVFVKNICARWRFVRIYSDDFNDLGPYAKLCFLDVFV